MTNDSSAKAANAPQIARSVGSVSPVARRQMFAVAIFLAVAVLFNTNYQMAVVHGESMLPTFHDGQLVLARRMDGSNLRRGDVVLVRQEHGRETLIKRVAYLPGDLIDQPESGAFRRVREYFHEKDIPSEDGAPPSFTLTVPAGYIVVLGDNRRVSDDSRMFGPVASRDIMGRVVDAPPAPPAQAMPPFAFRRPPFDQAPPTQPPPGRPANPGEGTVF